MTLSAEIKTGKRTVIDYLLSPLRQHVGEGIDEDQSGDGRRSSARSKEIEGRVERPTSARMAFDHRCRFHRPHIADDGMRKQDREAVGGGSEPA